MVNVYANFRALVGGKHVELPFPANGNLWLLLQALVERYPPLKSKLLDPSGQQLADHIHLFVNGRDVQHLPDALQTRLLPEDTVDIFPPVAGG